MLLNKDTTDKIYVPFEKFQNELYDYFYENENLDVKEIDKLLIKTFSERLNNTELAKFLGVSIRTVRNKKNEYGLKKIQSN